MSERLRGLPEFPSEESARYERTLNPNPTPPDRFVDRFRHAWPVYTILGVLLCFWVLALFVTGFSTGGMDAFWTVLSLPPLLFAAVVRIWFWSWLFSPRRQDE